MRKLILEEWMSLDGYVTDKKGGLDLFTSLSPQQNTYSDNEQLKFLETIDTILLGRKTYELFVDFWPTASTNQEAIADKLNETDKVVFTNSLSKAPWGRWKDAKIIGGEVAHAVHDLKSQPGKDIVLWGSISLAQSLMKENLIDEYHIQLCQFLNGGGRSLFTQEMNVNQLRLLESKTYSTGTIFLNYEPVNSF